MKEMVVISGKGGTGKTSITASFAALCGRSVIVDCDVDAADLHLIIHPLVHERHEFHSGHEAVIRPKDCIGCGICEANCRFDAIKHTVTGDKPLIYAIDPVACEGCGVCVRLCPEQAIDFPDRRCGEWMISHTRFGPMIHARLGIAAENSGKLVSIVRREARRVAEASGISQIITDGPPGTGCPVIASVTGATQVVIVTEPTVSGEHDMDRVLALTRHFSIPAAVCVNKWDINPEMTDRIEHHAHQSGARVLGRIPYDRIVTTAQIYGRPVTDYESGCADAIRTIWNQLNI